MRTGTKACAGRYCAQFNDLQGPFFLPIASSSAFRKGNMSQRENQRATNSLENARPLKRCRPKKSRRRSETFDKSEEVRAPRPDNLQDVQFQFPWMVETVENRINGMREAIREEYAASNRVGPTAESDRAMC